MCFCPELFILTFFRGVLRGGGMVTIKAGKEGFSPMEIVEIPAANPRKDLLRHIKDMFTPIVLAAGNAGI